MQHLDFILWMLLYPLSVSLCGYLDTLQNKRIGITKVYSKKTEGISAAVMIFIWLFIGYQLF
jgi:uncharacterized protein YlxP (DUF503 family)